MSFSLEKETTFGPTSRVNLPRTMLPFSYLTISDKFGYYPRCRLSQCIPKLAHIPYAENLADQLLQLMPNLRISARVAMRHKYFEDLPQKIYELPDGKIHWHFYN